MANKEKLRKVREQIVNHPENFNYSAWVIETAQADEWDPVGCGTTACIAGWTVLNECSSHEEYANYSGSHGIEDAAKHILELNEKEAAWLFLPWSENENDPFTKMSNYIEMRHLVKKNGPDIDVDFLEALARIDYLLNDGDISKYESPHEETYKTLIEEYEL